MRAHCATRDGLRLAVLKPCRVVPTRWDSTTGRHQCASPVLRRGSAFPTAESRACAPRIGGFVECLSNGPRRAIPGQCAAAACASGGLLDFASASAPKEWQVGRGHCDESDDPSLGRHPRVPVRMAGIRRLIEHTAAWGPGSWGSRSGRTVLEGVNEKTARRRVGGSDCDAQLGAGNAGACTGDGTAGRYDRPYEVPESRSAREHQGDRLPPLRARTNSRSALIRNEIL